MADNGSKSSTQSSSTAQNRFVVSLPKEVGEQIDALSKRLADQMRQQHGIGVEMSRAQVVQSLVSSALASLDEAKQETATV